MGICRRVCSDWHQRQKQPLMTARSGSLSLTATTGRKPGFGDVDERVYEADLFCCPECGSRHDRGDSDAW